MPSLEQLSYKELTDQLRAIQSTPGAAEGDTETSRLVLELQAHQIELEMQNRALREAQERLEASRARYVELYDRAPVGYATLDSRGIVREINLTAATLLGTSRDQLVSAPFSVIAGPEHAKQLFEAWRTVANGGGNHSVDLSRAGRSGPSVIEVRLMAKGGEGAAPRAGFQVIFVDVTDRRRASAERATLSRERRARAEAEAANHLKDEFLGIVSHELRTPLNALLGWIEILATRSDEPGVLERGLTVMRRNGHSLARLVDDLLDVSRIVSGKLQIDLAPVVMEDVVRNAIELAKGAAQAKDIRLTQSTVPGCRLLGDRVRLQQVVSNLLSNAVKFTSHGGHVDVVLVPAGTMIQLRVRDDGCGIDAADLPHVFERFRQGDSSTTRQHAGLGLGLAIARYIVEAHDGTIEGSSPGRGRGAEFVVTLPAMADQELAAECPKSTTISTHPGPSIAGVKVLCVDDEPDTLELMALMLTALGAAVRTAASVGDALAVIQSFSPDIVLSDVAMPGADGHELVARVRKLDAPLRDTPVVAFTACARLSDEIRAVQAGFDAYLPKPVDGAALARIVSRLLRLRAARGP